MIRGGLAAILLVSNCYLAAPWLALSHHQGSNLFNSMLIILFTIYFNLKFTGGLITRLCLKAQPRTQWGLNWEPADLEFNSLKITSTMSHSIPYPIQIQPLFIKRIILTSIYLWFVYIFWFVFLVIFVESTIVELCMRRQRSK